MSKDPRVRVLRQRVDDEGSADVSVRELLEWFGAKRRGAKVLDRLQTALESAGLHVGDAIARAGSDDRIRFHRDRPAEIVGAAVDTGGPRAAGVREGPSLGRVSPPPVVHTVSGDLVADLLAHVGAPLTAAPCLVQAVHEATGWLEVAGDLRRSAALNLGSGAVPMSWSRFEAATASLFDWETRGPLWYSSPVNCRVGTISRTGVVVFCRDGWWAPDWGDAAAEYQYVFRSWDDWTAHRLEFGRDGATGEAPQLALEGPKGRVLLSHSADDLPSWSSVSFAYADAVLRRVLPVVVRDLGQEVLGHPVIEVWDEARLRAMFGAPDISPAEPDDIATAERARAADAPASVVSSASRQDAFFEGLLEAMQAPTAEGFEIESPIPAGEADGASDGDLASDEPVTAIRLGPSLPDGVTERLRAGSELLRRVSLEDNRMGGHAVAEIPNRLLTAEACAAICARIRRDKVVPVWVPPEVLEHFEPFHKWNKVCWFIPWVLLANGMNGPLCVELQGLSVPDESGCFQLGLDIDAVEGVPEPEMRPFSPIPFPFAEDDPRWREWTFTMREGEGAITIYEYQPDPSIGFHLDIAAAILEVQWPVVERSRDSMVVVHLPEDPRWQSFERLEDIVAWGFEGTE